MKFNFLLFRKLLSPLIFQTKWLHFIVTRIYSIFIKYTLNKATLKKDKMLNHIFYFLKTLLSLKLFTPNIFAQRLFFFVLPTLLARNLRKFFNFNHYLKLFDGFKIFLFTSLKITGSKVISLSNILNCDPKGFNCCFRINRANCS